MLMALRDAHYSFLMIDVRSYGRNSDSSIFNITELSHMLRLLVNNLPPKVAFSENEEPLPFVVIADKAFPLLPNFMRPYSGRNCTRDQQIYNYRLSRARRTIENAFGIMASRWRIFQRPIIAAPEKATKIVCATAVQHNFLLKDELARQPVERRCCPPSYSDRINFVNQEITAGKWREMKSNFSRIGRQSVNRASCVARSTREHFKHYFNHEDVLLW